MVVNVKDLHAVLFALHVAAAQGTTLDLDGARTRALWNTVLPLYYLNPAIRLLPRPGQRS